MTKSRHYWKQIAAFQAAAPGSARRSPPRARAATGRRAIRVAKRRGRFRQVPEDGCCRANRACLTYAQEIGRLQAGYWADLILVETRRLSDAGASSDPLAAVVFTPFPEPVDTVMVNGRIVVEGGELLGLDVPALVERADGIAEGLRRASATTGRDYFGKG